MTLTLRRPKRNKAVPLCSSSVGLWSDYFIKEGEVGCISSPGERDKKSSNAIASHPQLQKEKGEGTDT
jgi:hypothetical protein